ncbi:MAG: transporter [Chitinophagales bacterium]|nr:MAG: transporter [Chitinophagales bacterium]
MKTIFVSLSAACALLHTLTAQSIDTITLDQCYHYAMQHYPLARQKEMLQQSYNLELKKLNTQYLPHLAVNAQATYQSEVPHVAVDIPLFDIPLAPKDQYKANVEVTQVIFDGNATRYQKKIQAASLQAQSQQIDVQLYQLKAQISSLYFSILLADAQLELNELLHQNIENQLNKVVAAVENGLLLPSNADVLKAELIKVRQQQLNLRQSKAAATEILAELTSLNITSATVLQHPHSDFIADVDISARPELQLFHLQHHLLESQHKSILARQLPKLGGFFQGGVGRPGLNLLDNAVEPYYIAGVKFTWEPWRWNAEKYSRQIIHINKKIIHTQQEVFELNTRAALIKQQAVIASLQQQLTTDTELIALREKITATAAVQLGNGVITATDYLTELNAEQLARLNQKTHEIQLEQAKAEYELIKGK